MKRHQIIQKFRDNYIFEPSFKRVSPEVVILLEGQLSLIINDTRALINDIFKLGIDAYSIKNILENEEKIEFISIFQSFKFLKRNEIKYSIHDFLYVQKEIYSQISAIFIENNYDWSKIEMQETSYNIDQDG